MAKLTVAIRGAQIADAVAGNGVEWTTDDVMGLDLKANDGLVIDTSELTIDYDGSTIGIKTNKLAVKDGGIAALQLGTDAVETLKIKAKNVTLAKIEDMGLESHILVADASLRPVSVAVSGDITITALGATAIGATKVVDSMVNDDVATGLAGDGLSATTGVMALDLNELTGAAVDVAADSIAIVDATDNTSKKESIADLATAMAGSGITATNGVLSADSVTNNIVEGDIQLEDESANCDGSNVTFTLANTPVANSLDAFLNGSRQIEGSGLSYTISGTTLTFSVAPASTDTLIIRYIIDNA